MYSFFCMRSPLSRIALLNVDGLHNTFCAIIYVSIILQIELICSYRFCLKFFQCHYEVKYIAYLLGVIGAGALFLRHVCVKI